MTKTPPTRIVHVTECLAAGTLTFLVQATRELAEAGIPQVLVFSRRPDTPPDVAQQFDSRVQQLEIESPRGGYLRYFKALRTALLQQLSDDAGTVVHLHSSKAGFLGRIGLVGLRQRPRIFYSPHGLSFLNRRYVLPSLVFATLEWLAARVDSTLVGCSRSEARLLARLGRQPAQVLENAVDDSFFAIKRQPTELPVVVSMGRVCYQKAPELFAAIATRCQIAEVPARFVWIGSGDPASEARLRAAGVEVTGWIQRDKVQQLLGRASIYVQTSRWEGMPLSVLQALAAGLPCVVSDVVGNRDAVRQGITGFVTSRLDETLLCLRRLLTDPALRQRFGEAARRDASERFSNTSFHQRLCRLYGVPLSAQTGLEAPSKVLQLVRPRLAAPNGLSVAQEMPRDACG